MTKIIILRNKQRRKEIIFKISALFAIFVGIVTLCLVLIDVFTDGFLRLNWQFLTSFPSRKPEEAGIFSALIGSIYLVFLIMIIGIPIGIGAAIYLEEYAKKNWFNQFIEINIANLAGVPSIIYGLLGLAIFVRTMNLGRSLLSGALTMTLLILPIIIISSREAIRAVPYSIREAAYALGARQWQTICHHILPLAFSGILTGIILAISRVIGETAPLVTLGALTYVTFLPTGLDSPFTVLPIQIFNWISRPQEAFHANAAAGIIILLLSTLILNGLAIFLRNYYQKKTLY